MGFVDVRPSTFPLLIRHTELRRTVLNHPEPGAMVVKMVVHWGRTDRSVELTESVSGCRRYRDVPPPPSSDRAARSTDAVPEASRPCDKVVCSAAWVARTAASWPRPCSKGSRTTNVRSHSGHVQRSSEMTMMSFTPLASGPLRRFHARTRLSERRTQHHFQAPARRGAWTRPAGLPHRGVGWRAAQEDYPVVPATLIPI